MGIIAKQSIRGTIVTYLGVAVGFVTTFFVLTRFLSTEDIGLVRVLIDAATLFVGLAQLGTNSSIIRFYPYFRTEQPNVAQRSNSTTDHGFFFWTLLVPLIGFCLFACVYWACRVPLSDWFGEKSPLFVDYYYMVIPLAFFMLYQTIFETNANVLMRIVLPRTVRELGVRIGLLVIYLLYAFRILSIDGFIIALCLNYGIAALINLCYLFSLGHISLRPDKQFLRENPQLVQKYLLYTGFLIISAVTGVLAPVLSSFFISAKMGLNYTGIFAIATYIAVMVSIPYRSVTAIASPQLARAIKEQNREETSHLVQQICNNLLLIGGIIFLLIWLNIDLIFYLLPNGETYAVARTTVLLLGLTQLLIASCSIALTTISYSRFYAFSLLFSLLLTVASLLLNNYLIPIYGMNGAAISNLASYTLYFAFALLILRTTCKISLFNRQTACIILLIGCVLLLNYLWNSYLPMIGNVWLSSLLRTAVLLGIATVTAWKKRLSPELYQTIRTILHTLNHH
ncbi:MAG: lipopolysaccharide biosynthesis protein [Paludibacteraceae bacterium]